MQKVRVLLADDHALMRAGLSRLLEAFPEVEVVAQASSGQECVEMAASLFPQVVLMDIAMPGMNGLEATAKVIAQDPKVQVVLLSMHKGEEYIRRALEVGARGYVLKDADPMELRLAIQTVSQGKIYLSPSVSRRMVPGAMPDDDSDVESLAQLTHRQREVLTLLADGLGTKEIAKKLKIGRRTVETHRYRIMTTLNIHDAIGLVHFAYRTGLSIPPS